MVDSSSASSTTTASQPPPAPFIRFRLSHIDTVPSYRDPAADNPLDNRESPFFQTKLNSVPVIRVFGATDRGQRVVAHVHGAFPYVFVKYDGPVDPVTVNRYIHRLGQALNAAIDLSLRTTQPYDQAKPRPTRQAIAFIVLCRGVEFYGYHVGHRPFLKIYFAMPADKKRLAEILRMGAVMGTKFDVYEEHASFLLQFMCDFNLFGCGWMNLKKCLFRSPLPPPDEISDGMDQFIDRSCDAPFASRTYTTETVPPRHIHSSPSPEKISYCALELDVSVADILNRDSIQNRGELHNSFLELLDPDKIQQEDCMVSTVELWVNETKRRAAKGQEPPRKVADSAEREWDSRREGDLNWKGEGRLWEEVEERAAVDLANWRKKMKQPHGFPTLDDFLERKEELQEVKTVLEQVDAVFMERMEKDRREKYCYGVHALRQYLRLEKLAQEQEVKSEERDFDGKVWGRELGKLEDDEEGAEITSEDETGANEHEPDEAVEDVIEDYEFEEEEEKPIIETHAGNVVEEKEDQERPPKRVKIGSPLLESAVDTPRSPPILRTPTPRSPSITKSPTTFNVFSSRTKPPIQVRVAGERSISPYFEESSSSDEDDLPPVFQHPKIASIASTDIASPSPSPTLFAPGPSTIPPHLRSATDLSEPLARSQPSDSDSDMLRIDLLPQTQASNDDDDLACPISFQPTSSKRSPSQQSLVAEIPRSSPSNSQVGQPMNLSNSLPLRFDSSSETAPHPVPTPLGTTFEWARQPPTIAEVLGSIKSHHKSHIVYTDPYYSNPKDVPPRPAEYGGRSFPIKGSTIRYLDPFSHWETRPPVATSSCRRGLTGAWEFAALPPSRADMITWLQKEKQAQNSSNHVPWFGSQIRPPTQINDGFKFVPVKGAKSTQEPQHLAILSVEIQVNTRGELVPDPDEDEIQAIFYCFQTADASGTDVRTRGVIVVADQDFERQLQPTGYGLHLASSEADLLNQFVETVRHLDPEIVAGFEIQRSSLGFLLARAESAYGRHLSAELGRVREQDTGRFSASTKRSTDYGQTSFTGRHVIPIWKTIQSDTRFGSYEFENVVFEILRIRVPHFSYAALTRWFQSGSPQKVSRVFSYWIDRVEMDIDMLEEGEIVSQNCESARVYGVDFNSVRTRGSQFKVEAVLFRITKPENFVLLSPSRRNVGSQNAAEELPLILEPKAAFYKGPLAVLDFASLYPSVMIAYNYCYSTCLGRVHPFQGTDKLGVSTLALPEGLLWLLKDKDLITISPNGLMFVKTNLRKSALAKMLETLLATRVMVKTGMKTADDDKTLHRALDALQLALKLLANVTYGYTSASFSGRMPMVELADAIVSTGRELLEKALELIQNHPTWGALVVYGDTDSLFVYIPGRTKEEAFRIGNEMADVVSSLSPRPVKLKFEKIYLPCFLVAKKRYVGFKFEFISETEPVFDAKGIETVRRDGTPATQKMVEACLRLFFRTSDLSLVKEYCVSHFKKILVGDVSIQDFLYKKAVKLGSYSATSVPLPGVVVGVRRTIADPRAEPLYGERVPYLIAVGEPGSRQVDRALSPKEFLSDPRNRLDAGHYITAALIKPLERFFHLVGADVKSWYQQMAKSYRVREIETSDSTPLLVREFYRSTRCDICGQLGDAPG